MNFKTINLWLLLQLIYDLVDTPNQKLLSNKHKKLLF